MLKMWLIIRKFLDNKAKEENKSKRKSFSTSASYLEIQDQDPAWVQIATILAGWKRKQLFLKLF